MFGSIIPSPAKLRRVWKSGMNNMRPKIESSTNADFTSLSLVPISHSPAVSSAGT